MMPEKRMSSGIRGVPLETRSSVKSRKKILPKAILQSRSDLTHHGLLEDQHRYDPRPDIHKASVPSPQAPDLVHDHFPELDRNQDGLIDPVERAFGRLDMDRDLDTRPRR